MKYRMLLGDVVIDGVIDVKESVKRDIKQYVSINGNAFCQDGGTNLKYWQAEIELCQYDKSNADGLLDSIRRKGKKGEPLLLSVNSDVGSFSSRVMISELETSFVDSETCRVTLGLLEYVKSEVSVTASSRPGAAPNPPSLISAGEAFKVTTQFRRTGRDIVVKNPLTGVDVGNIAAIDVDTIVKIEEIG